jgi:hypothetical protein
MPTQEELVRRAIENQRRVRHKEVGTADEAGEPIFEADDEMDDS